MLCRFNCGCEVGEDKHCGMCCPEAVAEREARHAAKAPAPAPLPEAPLDGEPYSIKGEPEPWRLMDGPEEPAAPAAEGSPTPEPPAFPRRGRRRG